MSQIDITIAFCHFFSFLLIFYFFILLVPTLIFNYFYKLKIINNQKKNEFCIYSFKNKKLNNLVSLCLININ